MHAGQEKTVDNLPGISAVLTVDARPTDLDGAILKTVRGLDTAALARARNSEKVIR